MCWCILLHYPNKITVSLDGQKKRYLIPPPSVWIKKEARCTVLYSTKWPVSNDKWGAVSASHLCAQPHGLYRGGERAKVHMIRCLHTSGCCPLLLYLWWCLYYHPLTANRGRRTDKEAPPILCYIYGDPLLATNEFSPFPLLLLLFILSYDH